MSLAPRLDSGVPSWSAAAPGTAASPAAVSAEAAEAAAAKLERIRHPSAGASSSEVVRFTEEEVNSYLYYDLASQYPPGLSKVNITFTPSQIAGTAEVDFDKAKAARQRPAPAVMDYLFWGVHTLAVEGDFSAVDGKGYFALASVSLDGVTLPRPLVDFLISTYLKPRFPGFDLDSPFPLPYSIDRVQVKRGSIEVAVKPADHH